MSCKTSRKLPSISNGQKPPFYAFKNNDKRSGRQKKGKSFDRLWLGKIDKNREFLMFENCEILTQITIINDKFLTIGNHFLQKIDQ